MREQFQSNLEPAKTNNLPEQQEVSEQQESKAEIPPDARLILPPEIIQAKEKLDPNQYIALLYMFGKQQMFGLNKCHGADWQNVVSELENITEDGKRYLPPSGTLSKFAKTVRAGYENSRASHDFAESVEGEVRYFVEEEYQGEPMKILEVCAGTSHSTCESWGQPWLARKFMVEYGDKIDILASDKSDDGRLIVIRNGHELDIKEIWQLFEETGVSELVNAKREEAEIGNERDKSTYGVAFDVGDLPNSRAIQDDNGQWKFIPIENIGELVNQLTGLSEDLLSDEDRNRYQKAINQLSECQIFIRPMLDPAFEQLIFGLKVKGGVDIEHLDEYFEQDQFDFIYGKNAVGNSHYDGWPLIEDVKPFGKSVRIHPGY